MPKEKRKKEDIKRIATENKKKKKRKEREEKERKIIYKKEKMESD